METDLSPDAAVDRFLSRLDPVDTLVVALSGGSDSTALLHLLHQRSQTENVPRLVAVTVDHGLRADSAAEAAGVAQICAALGIEHRTAKWSGRKPASGLQEAARLARYDLLRQAVISVGADIIVTGHTQDDQIETAIMRGERGTGRGLSGMAEAVLYQRDCWVLRPLLPVRRSALQSMLIAAGVSWIDDPSNMDERFERVRLRQSGAAASVDADVLSMIDHAAIARSEDAVALARFIEAHVVVHGGMIAELPQVPAEISEYLQQAIGVIAALMGGRSYRPGSKLQKQIARFSADVGPPRINLGRSVLDRRADRIFIYRERRGQRRLSIRPGRSSLWDGRYFFSNQDGARSFVVAPTGTKDRCTPLWTGSGSELDADIPAGVVSRARQSEPTILIEAPGGETAEKLDTLPNGLTVARHLALFDVFLPEFDRILADKCAGLFGRPAYREPPFV
jgi:tRNA(Ile)-lysidine synthase